MENIIGNLPVKVLKYNFLHWFERVEPDFMNELKAEVDYCGLQKHIRYNFEESKISEFAEITKNKEIILYESYNQFLWCLSYSVLVLFDEAIQKPVFARKYDGKLNIRNTYVKKAVEVFNVGMSLFSNYKKDIFYKLPNPEHFHENDRFYIERANGIFAAAMTNSMLHEFGHQFYKHTEYKPENSEQARKEEIDADEYAFDKISLRYKDKEGRTFMLGTLVSFCSMIFIDNTLKGDYSHPDPDIRIKNIIEKMDLHENDNLWAFVALIFKLWSNYYKINIDLPPIVETYKEMFYLTLENIERIKTHNVPY